MLTHYYALREIKLKALDHYQTASFMHLDAIERYADFYSDTIDLALKALRVPETQSGWGSFGRVMLFCVQGHLHLADKVQEDLIELAQMQTHGLGAIARCSIDDSTCFAPPYVENTLNVTGHLLAAGESVADSFGTASIDLIEAVDQVVKPRRGRRVRQDD